MNVSSLPKTGFHIDRPSFGASGMTGHIQKSVFTEPPAGPSFKEVMSNSVNSVNGVVTQPDALLKQAMTTGGVDVHDVMIANAKAELAVSLTAQFTTKVVQAYDRILQIQV
jgi:flagellar hook-basal body complex protein FliE